MEPKGANHLERALLAARDDASQRTVFERALLAADVYVLGAVDAPSGETVTAQPGSKIALHQWHRADGSAWIPVFTSWEVASASVGEGQPFVAMSGASLLEMASRGEHNIAINPKSRTPVDLTPDESQRVLATARDGGGDASGGDDPSAPQTGADAAPALRQPAEPSQALVDRLRALFGSRAAVRRAYLAEADETSGGGGRYLLVGVEADDNVNRLIGEAQEVLRVDEPTEQPVAFLPIQGTSELATRLVEHGTPFYERTLGRRIRQLWRR